VCITWCHAHHSWSEWYPLAWSHHRQHHTWTFLPAFHIILCYFSIVCSQEMWSKYIHTSETSILKC
jgi:hypothetical protein